MSSTILNRVINQREAILTNNAMTDPRFSHGASVALMRIRGVMCVPLVVGQQVYGSIYVDSFTKESTFSKDDLRLLGVIGSQASVILRNIQLWEEQRDTNAELAKVREDVKTIERTSLEMTTLLNDLLDVAKIESGKIQIEPSLTDLTGLVHNCYSLHRVWAEPKEVELKVEARDDVPEIPCDPKRVTQVLNNLISNAIKFSEAGDSIVIASRLVQDGELVEVSVTDTGQGIEPEDLLRLFGRYEQTSTKATGGEKGTGLGLAIARKLVELHHGAISVQSVRGRGSRFAFTLPVKA